MEARESVNLDNLKLTADYKERLANCINGVGAAVKDYSSVTLGISALPAMVSELKDVVQQLSSRCDEFDDLPTFCSTISSNCDSLEDANSTLSSDIDASTTEIETLDILTYSCADTIINMIDAVESTLKDGNANFSLSDYLSKNSLDNLFTDEEAGLTDKLRDAVSDIIGDKIDDKVQDLFGAIFAKNFGDAFEVEGNVAAGTISSALDMLKDGEFKPGELSVSAIKDLISGHLEKGIDATKKAIESGTKLDDTFMNKMLSKMANSKFAASSVDLAIGLAADVATKLIDDGEYKITDFIDFAANSAIDMVTEVIVDAAGGALGLTGIGGAAFALVGKEAVKYVLNGTYEGIKYDVTHSQDGMPHEYEHIELDDVKKALEAKGIDYGVPKYDYIEDQSVYDLAHNLDKDGAPDMLIDYVLAGKGVSVDVNGFFNGDEKSDAYDGLEDAVIAAIYNDTSNLDVSKKSTEYQEQYNLVSDYFSASNCAQHPERLEVLEAIRTDYTEVVDNISDLHSEQVSS